MMRRRDAAAAYFGDAAEPRDEEAPRTGRAAAVTAGVLAAQLALLQVALGYPGLGRLAGVNTLVIAGWLPLLLVAVVFAAACGVIAGVPEAAAFGRLRVALVGAAVAVAPVVVIVASELSAGPNRVIVALALLAVVVAGGLGAAVGVTAARPAWGGREVVGATLVWWFGQVARRVFIAVAGPRPPVNGQLTDAFLRAAAFTARWAPAVLAVACAVAVGLIGVVARRTGLRDLAVLGVLPAVVWSVAEALTAAPLAGALDAPWWGVLSCLSGGALGAGIGWGARRIRSDAR